MNRSHAVQQKIGGAVTGIGVSRIEGVVAAVAQRAQVSIVIGCGVIVLIPEGLAANSQQMLAALPGQAVDIAVCIVEQAAAEDGISAGEDASSDVLVGEAGESLIGKRDTYLGIARFSKLSG